MSEKLMKLRCKIAPTVEAGEKGMVIASSQQYDGSPFSIKINEVNVMYSSDTSSDGWIAVKSTGQQGDRYAITLPAPSIQFGKQVTVKDVQLAPLHTSLDMFKK